LVKKIKMFASGAESAFGEKYQNQSGAADENFASSVKQNALTDADGSGIIAKGNAVKDFAFTP